MKIDIPSMFGGRIGISDFWRAYVIGLSLNLFLSAINEAISVLAQSLFVLAFILFLLTIIPSIVIGIASIGLTVRRLHDLNLSGWWSFAPFGFLLFIIISTIYFSNPWIYIPVLILSILGCLGFLVFILFVPGKSIDNKYGSRGKYSSWFQAYFGNQQVADEGMGIKKTLRSKLSLDAILIGSLFNSIGSSVLVLALFPYVLSKYSLNFQDRDAFFTQLISISFSDPIVIWVSFGVGGIIAILAGYVAARIANRNYLLTATAVSFYCILSGVTVLKYLEPQYLILGIFTIAANPVLTFLGGYIRKMQLKSITA